MSNACGGMHPLWQAGDLMLIADHINMLGDNPLIGPNDETLGPRFPDMSVPYDAALRALAREVAADAGITLREGVYVAVPGPNLETRAEYRMLRTIGADVVGMSTVPEVIVARHGGMRVLGLSIITDLCLPDALEPTQPRGHPRAWRATAEPKLTRGRARRGGAPVSDGAHTLERRRAFRCRPTDAARRPSWSEQLLATWRDESLFESLQAARADAPPFVFYRGAAHGQRPAGHPSRLLAHDQGPVLSPSRDAAGSTCRARPGWDTHGLPVEIEVEKELQREKAAREGLDPADVAQLGGKQLIEETGVAEFNRRCRESVWKYRGDWESLSRAHRLLARLRAIRTSPTTTTTWSRSGGRSRRCTTKALLTTGHKILPYCARCGTALSSHEVAQGYQDVEDPSVYVALDLVPVAGADGARGASSCGRPRRGRWCPTRRWPCIRAHVRGAAQEERAPTGRSSSPRRACRRCWAPTGPIGGTW